MKTILIVDDLASVRFYHQHLLEQAGFAALTAKDGVEALGLLEQHPVDLLMLDLVMPQMSGAVFLERARTRPHHAKLPVLLVTSEADRGAGLVQAGQGSVAILQKPISPTDLLSAVRRLLG